MPKIDDLQFRQLLHTKLGSQYERAFKVFRDCGPNLAYDVVNVLLHAADKGKVDEVLGMLEERYRSHLSFQHPEIRGRVTGSLGVNETQALFLSICEKTLSLTPVA